MDPGSPVWTECPIHHQVDLLKIRPGLDMKRGMCYSPTSLSLGIYDRDKKNLSLLCRRVW